MTSHLAMVLAILFTSAGCAPPPKTPSIEALRSITQALADAVAPGEARTWDRYTDAALTYVSEDGEVKDKAAILAELKPLPTGISGTIRVTEFRAQGHGAFAVTTYVMEETETIDGQVLHNRYRETDTWRAFGGAWKLVAAQVLALNKDPPALVLPAASLDAYAGTYARGEATITLRRDGDHLVGERSGRPPQILRAEVRDVFFAPGQPRTREIFIRASDDSITGYAERREGEDLIWRKR
jgi:hypothetical protein